MLVAISPSDLLGAEALVYDRIVHPYIFGALDEIMKQQATFSITFNTS